MPRAFRESSALEGMVIQHFHPAHLRAVGNIDEDHELILLVEPHDGNEVSLVGLRSQTTRSLRNAAYCFRNLINSRYVSRNGGRSSFPEYRHLLEQRRITGLGRIANLHAVVEQRRTPSSAKVNAAAVSAPRIP